ncbi:PP2C family protein-serine/threonine phosphatase [Streptomyces winkii]|uniref:PP2C family protein-serine/threonine phosphatase n=1 Tax=Streptomyces winkii TaxID=3051178 RepID=UPI0028D2C403|nr:PP2C family protein-serine/threonine phosphatase [Streptomyces sp. DSM 40971]
MSQRSVGPLSPSIPASHWMLAIPVAWIVIVVVADVTAPPFIHLGPLLVAAPAITASFAGPRMTGLIALLAVAAQSLIAVLRDKDELISANHQAQIAALVLVGVSLVVFCVVQERRARELTQVRRVAETAQQLVLRPLPERVGPLRMASLYLAAEAEARIGGDLYAAARTGSSTRLLIGDVRGKGMSAVGDAALLIGAFRAAVHERTAMAQMAALLDESVTWNLGDPARAEGAQETFITASLLDISDEDSGCDLVVCGHPPPLLLRKGHVTTVEGHRPAPPLGLGKLAHTGYHVDGFELEAGDLLLLYTDGITEARDRSGRFYPLAERIEGWTVSGPDALLQRLAHDLRHHVGGPLNDDAAVIAVERLP